MSSETIKQIRLANKIGMILGNAKNPYRRAMHRLEAIAPKLEAAGVPMPAEALAFMAEHGDEPAPVKSKAKGKAKAEPEAEPEGE